MMDRSQEVRSLWLSSAAMHSAHAAAMLAGSGFIRRAKQSMHGMHRGRHHRWRSVPSLPVNQIVDRGLGEAVEGTTHMFKPCVHRSAAGDHLHAEDRVTNDADRALRCGRPCAMWPCWLTALFQRFWQRLTVISRAERLITDGSSSLGEMVMIGGG